MRGSKIRRLLWQFWLLLFLFKIGSPSPFVCAQNSKKKELDYQFIKGFGILKVDLSQRGNYIIETQVKGLEKLEVLSRNKDDKKADLHVLIAIINNQDTEMPTFFGFFTKEGGNEKYFFSANTLSDYTNRHRSFNPSPFPNTFMSFHNGITTREALSFAIYNLVSQHPDVPQTIPSPMLDNVIRCQGSDAVSTADICRNGAIKICNELGYKVEDISTAVKPDGQGGFFGETYYSYKK